jgi:outer membrane lipoprotein-sorting protein
MGALTLRIALTAVAIASVQVFLAQAPVAAATPSGASDAASSQSETLVSQVAAQLGYANGIRAHFIQTQTRAALKEPLVSSGTLVLVRGRGIVWHIESPYQAMYLITDTGVSEIDATGHKVAGANGRGTTGARGVAEVSRMMRAMLGGDLSALYSQFDVQASGTPSQWHMQLTPNQPQLAQAIKGLQMSGSSYLQSLRIALASGDITELLFSDTTAITTLTPAEQQLFGAQ